jgi:two-component system cell cycle response regulator
MADLDPFSDIDRMEPADRRRGAARRRVLKPGKIMRVDNQSLVDCQMRDVSDTGARLRCADQASVPKEFYLIFPADGMKCLARVMWRRGDELGIHFIGEREPVTRRKG